MSETPKHTPLYDLHVKLGGRMVPFAGYAMPVQYPAGILKEHAHTREAAGFFDVSHMGQAFLDGVDGDVAAAFETLAPGDVAGLAPGRQRYSVLLNEAGGIMDDLMVACAAPALGQNRLFLVVNASMKDADFTHIEAKLQGRATLTRLDDRALFALQGPKAVNALARHAKGVEALAFMASGVFDFAGVRSFISRSGYTGEDGFEISVPAAVARDLADKLLAEPEVAPIGLGARDSLRLEAGLCLYGHDIDAGTSPIEAGLAWAIAKRRRQAGDFPGAARILKELAEGPARRRVGILPEGRAPVREGAEILNEQGETIGVVTSGGFGPTVNGPIAMGYVATAFAVVGAPVQLMLRGKALPGKIAALPFTPHRYVK